MKNNINAAVIGIGKMGILHLGILSALKNVQVKSIAEKQGFFKNAIKTFLPAIHIYDDYEKMLHEEDLDVVYITTPTFFHVQMAECCIDNGVNFFIEKPLGISSEESKSLIKKVNTTKIINMIGYNMHFTDTFKKAKEILDSNILGKPVYLKSHMYVSQLFSKGSGWRYKKASSGGGVLNILGTHLVDILYWYFGDIVSVQGGYKKYYSREVEDFVHSYLVFSSGLEGFMDVSWSIRNHRLPEVHIDIQCEKGMLIVGNDYVKYFRDSEKDFKIFYKQDLYKGVEIYVGAPEYTREDAYMINCVKKNITAQIDITYGYKIQCITDAIYESAETKKHVLVNYKL